MLSVIIITKNEEKTIARCIKSVAWAKQIIVIDSGSDDATVSIARSLNAQVLETDWPGYGIQKQRALELAQEPWVLSLDADEFIENGGQSKIMHALQTDIADAFRLPIKMIFQNQKLNFAGCVSKHIRLFKREGAKFSHDAVHEKIIIPPHARIKACPTIIWHESYQDWTDALYKMNYYSSLSAQRRSKKTSLYKACIASSWFLFQNLILKGWIIDGRLGFLLAVYQAQGSWYRYLKQLHKDVC
jgi:glycosyltransferase involved in cell wall biosynthesis